MFKIQIKHPYKTEHNTQQTFVLQQANTILLKFNSLSTINDISFFLQCQNENTHKKYTTYKCPRCKIQSKPVIIIHGVKTNTLEFDL